MARAMGIDPATQKYVPFDITDKKFAINYMNLIHHPLEKQGIDFWWLDWQQEANTKLTGVSPTWWLNYVHFTDQEREGKRPLIFHRWGGMGNHRYEIGFSGDTVSVWDSLAFQPWFTANAANVGYAYWSHDIGGHMPGSIEPELYTRWIQFGIFSPILRTHTTKNPDAERRIWAYPEPYSAIMRDTFQLRYAMQPYIYSEARRTYDTGLAFLHPLYYDWPDADAAYKNKSEYIFGSEMIVAPVTVPVDAATQLASESIWIPEGDWVERATGKHFKGPANVTRQFSIDQIPVYVRSGAIVPLQPPMQYTGQKPVDPLILRILPLADAQSSTYTLYEDSGRSVEYKHGVCAWTKLSAKQAGDTLHVEIAPVEGSYPDMPSERTYQIQLPGDWPPESVVVNGVPLQYVANEDERPEWRYDGRLLMTILTTPRFSVHTDVHIEIERAAGSLASRDKLDGFAGSITRLKSAYDTLNSLWPLAKSTDHLIDTWQTGDRLSYTPQHAQVELDRFPGAYAVALKEVQELVTQSNVSDEEIAKHLGQDGTTDVVKEKLQRYRSYLRRALSQLEDGKPN
jgi:alpha-glucosidase